MSYSTHIRNYRTGQVYRAKSHRTGLRRALSEAEAGDRIYVQEVREDASIARTHYEASSKGSEPRMIQFSFTDRSERMK